MKRATIATIMALVAVNAAAQDGWRCAETRSNLAQHQYLEANPNWGLYTIDAPVRKVSTIGEANQTIYHRVAGSSVTEDAAIHLAAGVGLISLSGNRIGYLEYAYHRFTIQASGCETARIAARLEENDGFMCVVEPRAFWWYQPSRYVHVESIVRRNDSSVPANENGCRIADAETFANRGQFFPIDERRCVLLSLAWVLAPEPEEPFWLNPTAKAELRWGDGGFLWDTLAESFVVEMSDDCPPLN